MFWSGPRTGRHDEFETGFRKLKPMQMSCLRSFKIVCVAFVLRDRGYVMSSSNHVTMGIARVADETQGSHDRKYFDFIQDTRPPEGRRKHPQDSSARQVCLPEHEREGIRDAYTILTECF